MDICHILEQLRSSSDEFKHAGEFSSEGDATADTAVIHSMTRKDSRYEKMKCAQATYERLPDVQLELAALELDAKEEEELLFHNDDGSVVSVVVERNLCAADLCQLLALKNRVGKDVSWTLVEHWDRLGLERSLEDHEEVLTVYRETQCRFIFRKDFRKYEFFHSPTQFFPPDMVDLDVGLDQPQAVQSLLAGECPPVFSQVWIREPNKNVWCKAFLLLRDRNLYISHKVQIVAKFLRTWKCSNKVGGAGEEPVLWARLSDNTVYTTLNARNQFRAPTEFGLCLRGSGSGGGTELRCLACETERARVCWLTAMRLAKYGKQLRDNYRSFKTKTISHLSPTKPLDVVRSNRNAKPNEYSSLTVPNESVRSRVAMDFTGSVGRIVDDPQEARAIAVAEGYSWKRRWRPTIRGSTPSLFHHSGLEAGIHTTQPWFHSGMSRDQATQLVNAYGTVDGVFLVRESRSSPGSFVLTYKCGGKVLHSQIQPVMDPVKESVCYSLDSGVTKFYDLLQLVEFYQLNAGCLPTRLTHYIVQSPTGPLYAEKRTIPASF